MSHKFKIRAIGEIAEMEDGFEEGSFYGVTLAGTPEGVKDVARDLLEEFVIVRADHHQATAETLEYLREQIGDAHENGVSMSMLSKWCASIDALAARDAGQP